MFEKKDHLTAWGWIMNDYEIWLVETGVGLKRAIMTTRAAIDWLRPIAVIGLGLAGAVSAELNDGELVVPETVAWISNPELRISASPELTKFASSINDPQITFLPVANTMTVPRLFYRNDKLRLSRRVKDCAVLDMESYGLGWVCKSEEIPFMILRSISDSQRRTMPPWWFFMKMAKAHSVLFRLGLACLFPHYALLLARLHRACRQAARVNGRGFWLFMSSWVQSPLAGAARPATTQAITRLSG